MQARNKGFYHFLKNSFEEKKALENLIDHQTHVGEKKGRAVSRT